MFAELLEEQAWQIGRGKNPQDANEDDREAEEQGVPDELANGNGIARQRAQDFRQLQADEDEHESVQQKFNHLPYGPAPETRAEGDDLGHSPAEMQPGGHDGEHARNPQ